MCPWGKSVGNPQEGASSCSLLPRLTHIHTHARSDTALSSQCGRLMPPCKGEEGRGRGRSRADTLDFRHPEGACLPFPPCLACLLLGKGAARGRGVKWRTGLPAVRVQPRRKDAAAGQGRRRKPKHGQYSPGYHRPSSCPFVWPSFHSPPNTRRSSIPYHTHKQPHKVSLPSLSLDCSLAYTPQSHRYHFASNG